MAGRIRTVKPELLHTERYAKLSDAAVRLLHGLYMLADDAGNAPAGIAYLAGQVFYARPRSSVSIGKLLAELEVAGWIRRYVVDGAQYASIRGWTEKGSITYQRIDKPQPPKFPRPSSVRSSNGFDDGSDPIRSDPKIGDLRNPDARARTRDPTEGGPVGPPGRPAAGASLSDLVDAAEADPQLQEFARRHGIDLGRELVDLEQELRSPASKFCGGRSGIWQWVLTSAQRRRAS